MSDLSQKPLATDYMFRKDILCCRSYSEGLLYCTDQGKEVSNIKMCPGEIFRAEQKFSVRGHAYKRGPPILLPGGDTHLCDICTRCYMATNSLTKVQPHGSLALNWAQQNLKIY